MTFFILLIEATKLLIAVGGFVFAIVFAKKCLTNQSSPLAGLAYDQRRTANYAFLLNFLQQPDSI